MLAGRLAHRYLAPHADRFPAPRSPSGARPLASSTRRIVIDVPVRRVAIATTAAAFVALGTSVALATTVTGRPGVKAGRLRLARQLEPLTAVLISINKAYKTRSGVAISGVHD